MVCRIGAQVAFLAFAVVVFVGLRAGNTPVTILQRALLALLAGFVIGQCAAWAARLVLRDYVATVLLKPQTPAAPAPAATDKPEPAAHQTEAT
jgi:hypothetical protein